MDVWGLSSLSLERCPIENWDSVWKKKRRSGWMGQPDLVADVPAVVGVLELDNL